MNLKSSIIASVGLFIVATSCCWLPFLAIALGGGSLILSISDGIEKMSGVLMFMGASLLLLGIYQYIKRRKDLKSPHIILQSEIICPSCGHRKTETMSTNSCQYYYDCEHCGELLKPLEGDCCVFCSFGSVKCPPIQAGEECC